MVIVMCFSCFWGRSHGRLIAGEGAAAACRLEASHRTRDSQLAAAAAVAAAAPLLPPLLSESLLNFMLRTPCASSLDKNKMDCSTNLQNFSSAVRDARKLMVTDCWTINACVLNNNIKKSCWLCSDPVVIFTTNQE